MGYARRRAVLNEIERLCSAALLAYCDSANALRAGEADRFWGSLALLRAAAEQLDRLLWPGETAEWLGISDRSPLRQQGRSPFPEPFPGVPLPDCARFFDSDLLPSLLAAVADLNHSARERIAYMRQMI
jgi:hypothetical protein